jgi:hypothetical protein
MAILMPGNINNSIVSEDVSSFENNLNKYRYQGVCIGSLIATPLNLDLLYGEYKPSKFIFDLLQYYRSILRPQKKQYSNNIDYEKAKGLPLITFISERDHIFNMSYSIYKILGYNNVVCLLMNPEILKKMEIKPLHYLFFDELPKINIRKWRRTSYRLVKSIQNEINSFTKSYGIFGYYRWRIYSHLALETKNVQAFIRLINILSPSLILTEHDRFSYIASLISVAKRSAIPTYTMVHGTINNSIGYTPLLADRVFCWGGRQELELIKYGVERKAISITGAPQLHNTRFGDRHEILKTNGLFPETKIVLLATNPLTNDLRLKLVRVFEDALDELKDDKITGVIKLHPSEDVDYYRKIIKKDSLLILDHNMEIDYNDSFVIADIVCTYNSAFGMDSILKGLPVITININDHLLGQARDLSEYGGLPVVTSAFSLAQIITRYFSDSTYRHTLQKKVQNYSASYCKAFSEDAAHNIIEQIGLKSD